MELFMAEKIAEVEACSERKCRACGRYLEHIWAILDSHTGKTIHLFRCQCGERIWDE